MSGAAGWCFVFCALASLVAPTAYPEDSFSVKALSLQRSILSIDAHIDIPTDFATPAADPGEDGSMQVDLPKLDRSGQTGAVFAVFVPQEARNEQGYRGATTAARAKLAAIHRMATQYPNRIGIARSVADVEALHAAGKHVAHHRNVEWIPVRRKCRAVG